jgi:hypothetical protein
MINWLIYVCSKLKSRTQSTIFIYRMNKKVEKKSKIIHYTHIQYLFSITTHTQKEKKQKNYRIRKKESQLGLVLFLDIICILYKKRKRKTQIFVI